ncbi:TonB-dependent receptor domain-containing protein [Sphingobium phenoxybenzoativorans]|uniref:TonB-dependent receptor domain-containing protein n=1 Tax=Sphingobium phenoxybenzoativorans TaxID=1592790 RepID=UPI00087305FC|nr:TonB-dependent receptor [Sphingobium phenoxybenzoativorans]
MPRGIERLCIAAALVAATPAGAAERQNIDIAPGRLGDAIIALGKETGSSIGTSDPWLADLSVRGVKGRLSVGQALSRLLSGTGAKAERIDDANWRIVRAPRPRAIARAPAAQNAPALPAQEGPGEDIIVTASKREVPIGRFAGTVEIVDTGAFGGTDAAGGTSALIARVASLSSTYAGAGRNKLFIRAIADSGFAGPTQATTGQYLGDMRLNYAAPDPDLRLYDMAAVEVLEGPQGTLYGAGSLGGIIRLVPNAPNLSDFGGQVSAGVSATQHGAPGGDTSATLNLPIVSGKLGLRIVGYASTEGGYIDDILRNKNDVNRTNVEGGRAALRFAPDDNWTIDISGLYQRIQGDDAQYASRSIGRLKRETPFGQNYASGYSLANARIERRWDDISFVSTTGVVRHRLSERYDATQDGRPPELYFQRNRTELFSTENRLSRDLHDGLGWLIGVSYLNNRSSITRTLGPPGLPTPSTGVRNRLSEWTGFAEASVQPLNALIVTFGGRVTRSRLSGSATDLGLAPEPVISFTDVAMAEAQANRRETIFLPSASILTNAIAGVTLFVRYQQGFRPGGLAVDDYHVTRFRNDRVGTLEAGMRHGAPGYDPIALAASVAYTDWNNIQADLTDRRGLPTTTNIGDGRIFTLEGRVVLTPAAGFSIDASMIYNGSLLSQPASYLRTLNYEGRSLSLPNVANLGGRLSASYNTMLSNGDAVRLLASARYVGKSRLGVGPIFGREQGDYVDTSLSGNWTRGPVRFSIDVTNLLDLSGNRFALGTPFDLESDEYTPMRPRTVRAGVEFRF